MATRATRKTTAPRGGRLAAASPPPPAAPAPAPAPLGGAELLKAGLKAVAGHNPLFETLFDIDAAHQRQRKELFKLPTFEDLFNDRVARALDQLGVAKALEDLRAQIAVLDKRLRHVERLLETRADRAKR